MGVPDLDEHGLLPPGCHPATTAEVEEAFVTALGSPQRRAQLFASWRTHTEVLQHLIAVARHWLGGSFTTSKPDPNDIDFVAFVDGPAYEAAPKPEQLLVLYMLSGHAAVPFWGCDAFYVAEFPEDHPGHARQVAASNYWEGLWSKTRPDDDGTQLDRGFIEVPT